VAAIGQLDEGERRRDAFFDRYPLSGNTYTTHNGAVVPNELLYFDGEMAHLHGECANVAALAEALTGSGYKPLLLRYSDERTVGIGQIWCSRFTDTTIGAYSAMFLVIVVVGSNATGTESTIAAHPNGASSAVAMLRGSFDPPAKAFESGPRLFMFRLVDTTQVAIDVGRERMGTDKRPGAIDMSRAGERLRIAVRDNRGCGIINADVAVAPRPEFGAVIADAARAAGADLRELPAGTEYVYTSVARIDRGPIVTWNWRTDVVPSLHPVAPGSVTIDDASEEGRILRAWGFTPKVLGYIPHVRGMIAGLAPALTTSLRQPRPLLAYPGTFPVSKVSRADGAAPDVMAGQDPRWPLTTRFLGSMCALLRKESIGVTPDGLRINWHVTEGRFAGPGVEATVLPGAADWMCIRADGIGLMNVRACLETPLGARVYASYVGHCDFGPDGYARALRDDFGSFPPVVVTLTFSTADPQLSWLNRVVAIGTGRVDVRVLRIDFDVHAVSVADTSMRRDDAPVAARSTVARSEADRRTSRTLYERMGGREVIAPLAEDFIGWVIVDDQLGRLFGTGYTEDRVRQIRRNVVDFFCRMSGGDCVYRGGDMKAVHAGLGITESDWKVAAGLLIAALTKYGVQLSEQHEFMRLIEEMKPTIVNVA
jgi:truncated hemoglobin YjbI